MLIKGMMFDLDGTLADTMPLCARTFQYIFKKFLGREISEAEIIQMFGPTEEGIIQNTIPDKAEEALACYVEKYREFHSICESPFEGISSMLEFLQKKDMKLAVVTGKGVESARISMEYLELDRFFSLVETGTPNGACKPEAFERVLNRWKLLPEEVGYVGDTPYDMQSARSVGLQPLGAGWAPDSTVQKTTFNGFPIFTTVDQLVVWLGNHI
jgi:pyrophosphatase PpaX